MACLTDGSEVWLVSQPDNQTLLWYMIERQTAKKTCICSKHGSGENVPAVLSEMKDDKK